MLLHCAAAAFSGAASTMYGMLLCSMLPLPQRRPQTMKAPANCGVQSEPGRLLMSSRPTRMRAQPRTTAR